MRCPRCEEENPPQAKFCLECAAPLTVRCGNCGVQLPPTAKYCFECAAPVATTAGMSSRPPAPAAYTPRHLAERILATRSAIEGERKQVTVLFCDLCDSMPLAQTLGAEGMHGLLNRFFERAMREIHRLEGTLNQFLGDGFMAIFGAPLALEDHARRAVLAALAIRKSLAEEPLAPGVADVGIRIGINTGPVVIGRIGDDLRMDYTAIGDTTNVAARLQQHAAPGDILASVDVRRLTHEAFRWESVGAQTVKGKDTPVETYRLVGTSPRPISAARGDPALSPFVGRDPELSTLRDLLGEAERGRGLAVGVVGEPGIGKSRLLFEFRRLTAAHATCFEGRALPYSPSVPYSLVLDVLRSGCGIVETDPLAVVAEKVQAALIEADLAADDHADSLLSLLGVPRDGLSLSPELLRRKAFDAVRLLFLRWSRHRPVVIALEDLHWTDRDSDEFFAELSDSLSGARMMLLATYRPGYTPPWIGRSWASQVSLRPLSSNDCVRMIGTAVNDAVAARVIVDRAEGNPFFLEELVRAGDAASTAVPETVEEVIAARIDRLPEHPKRLLQLAAVVGRDCPRRLLDRIWDGPRPLEAWIHALTRAELMRTDPVAKEETLTFRHALTQSVAYGSLLGVHRRALHRAVGRALEVLHGDVLDPFVEVLAHHYGLSDDHEHAVDYAIRAGGKAQRRWANAAAAAHFSAALTHLASLPATPEHALRRIDAVLAQSELRFALGDHAEHLRALEAIGDLVAEAGDPRRRAEWHYWMGFLQCLTGSPLPEAISQTRKAATIARESGDDDIAAQAHSCLAQISVFVGDFPQALAEGERALSAFEAVGNLWWACRALAHLSPAANAIGAWERSVAYCTRALEHAETLDDRRLRIAWLGRLASALVQRGTVRQGLERCEEALAMSPAPFDAAVIRAVRGHGLVRNGEVATGVVQLSEIIEWFSRSHLRYTHTQVALWLAEGHLRAGDRTAARALLEATAHTCTALGYRHLAAVAHRLLGEALIPDPAADDHIALALVELEAVGARNEVGRALVAQARLLRARGKEDEARSAWAHARSVFAALGTVEEFESPA